MPRERHPNETAEEREFRLLYGKSPSSLELVQFRKHKPRINFDETPRHLQEEQGDPEADLSRDA